MRVLVLASPPGIEVRPDTADTLVQVEEIAARLSELGHVARVAHYAPERNRTDLADFAPHVVFNLVEDLPEGPGQLHEVAEFLERQGVRVTGAAAGPLRTLARKPEMKARLRAAALPVPASLGDAAADRYIVKSAIEHASLGLSADNVVSERAAALRMIETRQAEFGGEWFAEAYIDGREFSVALLGRAEEPTILPPAEILFTDHGADAPRIVGYAEKWDTRSAAYQATQRVFPAREELLFSELKRLACAAWDMFELTGYARVDFRVDRHGQPYILEVNANPCLAADAGFCAAAAQLGLSQADVVARLLEAARGQD